MEIPEFARLFEVRAENLMWLLGAGASASAGVPTATDMVWEFRRALYCSSQGVSISRLGNLADPVVRATLENHFVGSPTLPAPGSPDEYSLLFELAYPSEHDRRAFIERAVRNAAPSFGHIALSTLMEMGHVNMLWTTNFDRLIEDAAAKAFGSTGRLVTAQIETSNVLNEALRDSRWPLLGKLHGDFQSSRLKNTTAELQAGDSEMRTGLEQSCQRFGLAVVGYSGRDTSVMESLLDAIEEGDGFPHGLFWFHSGSAEPSKLAQHLLASAQSAGVDAYMVRIDTFDELFDRLLALYKIPEKHRKVLTDARPEPRRSPTALNPVDGGWPIVRMNAFPVVDYPRTCRLIDCDIGGTSEVKAALKSVENAVAVRRRDGVIAFGSDHTLQGCFSDHAIRNFDLGHISVSRGNGFETADMSLLYDALLKALSRERPLVVRSDRERKLAVDTDKEDSPILQRLMRCVNELSGTVPGTSLRWEEAIQVSLSFQLSQLWLVYDPVIWLEPCDDSTARIRAVEFSRERMAARYNSTWNELLHSWEQVLRAGVSGKPVTLTAFDASVGGVNASFKLQGTAAHSWRTRNA